MNKFLDINFHIYKLLLFYFLFSIQLNIQAQTRIELPTNSQWTITLIDELEVIDDEQRKWTAEKLFTISDDIFKPNTFKEKPRSHNYWARFKLANVSNDEQWINFESYYWDYVTLYIRDSTGNINMLPFGILSKPYNNRLLVQSNTEYSIIANFTSSGQFRREDKINLVIKPTISVLEGKMFTNYMDGIAFGVMFSFALYNLFLFISLRDRTYFWYSIYILAFAISFATLFANTPPKWTQFFTSDYPLFAFYAKKISDPIIWIAYVNFVRNFLTTKDTYPIADKILKACIALIMLQFLINLTGIYHFSGITRVMIWNASVLICIALGIYSYINGHIKVYFILGQLFLMSGLIITFMFYAGIDVISFLPKTQFFNYFRSPASVFAFGAAEAIVFSFALANKYNIMQKNITRIKVEKEKEKLEQLQKINIASSKFVPSPFLNFLGKENILNATLGDHVEKQVNVLFSDIRDYTRLSENMTPEDNFKFVNAFNSRMGPIIRKNKGFINQYLGDGIMAIFPEETEDTLKAAIEMQKNLNKYNELRISKHKVPIRMGIGIHTGPLILGIIGDEQRMDAATISDTVNVASRIEGLTKHFRASILLSEACVKKLKHAEKFNLRYLGPVQVKGKRQMIKIYECFDGEKQEIIDLKRATLPAFEKATQLYFEKKQEASLSIFKNIVEKNPMDLTAHVFLEKVNASLKVK